MNIQPDANPVEPDSELGHRTLPDLTRQLFDQLSTLFRQEINLAIAELSRSFATMLTAASSVAVAAALAFAGLLVLLSAAVLALALVIPAWLAALVVGIVVLLVAAVLLRSGISRFRTTALLPERTAQSLRQDKDVLTRKTAQ